MLRMRKVLLKYLAEDKSLVQVVRGLRAGRASLPDHLLLGLAASLARAGGSTVLRPLSLLLCGVPLPPLQQVVRPRHHPSQCSVQLVWPGGTLLLTITASLCWAAAVRLDCAALGRMVYTGAVIAYLAASQGRQHN